MNFLTKAKKMNGLRRYKYGGHSFFNSQLLKILILGMLLSIINLGCTTSPDELLQANQSNVPTINNLRISPIFTPEVLYWQKNILIWAKEWGLDPNLVATVMQIESCGDPLAISASDARGLFQVMPYHFDEGDNSFNPNVNAKRGLSYLSKALKSGDNTITLALAGYNGGITGAQRSRELWNNEMQRYVYWGENIYQEANSGDLSSPTLMEWLNSGGSSLCEQAKKQLMTLE